MAVRFLLAREFHKWPWEVDDAPIDEVMEAARLLGYLPRDPAVVVVRR